MATQLFFLSAASDYGTGNNDANLRGTAFAWNPLALSTARGTPAASQATSTVAGATVGVEVGSTTVANVWYSPPLAAAATISGSITWNLRAAESSNSANVAINGRLEVIDGATGAITLIDATARVTELGLTTEAANNFAETPAAGIACKKGDRLRVRVYGDDAGTMGSGFTFTFWYNGPTAAASGDSYLTLTETLTFVSEPAGTQVFPTDTASAVVATPTLISSFTGADEDPLSESGNWAKLDSGSNALRRLSNAAARSTVGGSSSYYTRSNYADLDAYVTVATLPTGSNEALLIARITGEGGASTWGGYVARIVSTSTILGRYAFGASAATIASTTSVTWAAGDKIGIRCRGTAISLWRYSGGTWTQLLSGTDATYPTGKIGLGTNDAATRFDDVYIGDGIFDGLLVTREAWTSRGAGVQTDVTNTAAGWTAPIQVTDTAGGTVVDWFTRPLTAFTLGGAVRCNIRGLESNALANASVRVEVARVDGDGTSPAVWAVNTFPTELTTSEAVQSFLVSGDDLAITAGQRLRIRLYIDDWSQAAMGASQTITTHYAGASSATGDTFLTFTQTLTEAVSAYQPRHGFVNFQNPGVL